jgi:Leucine-rich repeat (LRR) protein
MKSGTSGKKIDSRVSRFIQFVRLNSKKAFDGLLQLLTLNLSKNAIETIPTDAFFGLVSLRKMDLSWNSIEKLDNKTNSIFEDCLSLQEVCGCQISIRTENE